MELRVKRLPRYIKNDWFEGQYGLQTTDGRWLVSEDTGEPLAYRSVPTATKKRRLFDGETEEQLRSAHILLSAEGQRTTSASHENAESSLDPQLAYAHSYIFALHTHAEWGHCYENAYRVFFAFPSVFHPDGVFVEGWVVFRDAGKVVLMEHGWLVRGAQLFDPTLVLVTMPDQPIFYFPGVIRSWSETDTLENEFFPHVRFSGYGEDGMEHPGYKAAYLKARERAQAMVSGDQELLEIRAGEPAVTVEQDDTTGSMGAVMIITLRGDEPDIHVIRPQE